MKTIIKYGIAIFFLLLLTGCTPNKPLNTCFVSADIQIAEPEFVTETLKIAYGDSTHIEINEVLNGSHHTVDFYTNQFIKEIEIGYYREPGWSKYHWEANGESYWICENCSNKVVLDSSKVTWKCILSASYGG